MKIQSNKFLIEGDIQDFTQGKAILNNTISLLSTMTGIEHAKTDLVSVSVSIEVIMNMLAEASDKLNFLTISKE